jgi:hypothetical protein
MCIKFFFAGFRAVLHVVLVLGACLIINLLDLADHLVCLTMSVGKLMMHGSCVHLAIWNPFVECSVVNEVLLSHLYCLSLSLRCLVVEIVDSLYLVHQGRVVCAVVGLR